MERHESIHLKISLNETLEKVKTTSLAESIVEKIQSVLSREITVTMQINWNSKNSSWVDLNNEDDDFFKKHPHMKNYLIEEHNRRWL